MDRSFVLLISLFSAALFGKNLASWTQQYGDAHSTNYVAPTTPVAFQSPWKLNVYPPGSNSLDSAISDEGVLFHTSELNNIPQANLVAVSPEGKILWIQNFTKDPDYVCAWGTTNILYSSKFNLVIIGCGVNKPPDLGQHFSVWALNATTGERVWRTPLSSQSTYDNIPIKTLSLSESSDSLFYFGSNCKKRFLIFDLKNGSVKNVSQNLPCDTHQWAVARMTKITNWKNGTDLLLVTFYSTQQLMAVTGKNLEKILWKVEISSLAGFSRIWTHVSYAFSKLQGVVYGSVSREIVDGAGQYPVYQYYAFGVGISNGSLLFNRTGYCDNVTLNTFAISPPVVDDEGYAYYSCGYQVFSIYPDGTLRWKSRPLMYPVEDNKWWLHPAHYPPLIPSLHPQKKLLYTVDLHGDVIFVVSATNGTVVRVTSVVGIQKPPILVGDLLMYVLVRRGEEFSTWFNRILGLEQ